MVVQSTITTERSRNSVRKEGFLTQMYNFLSKHMDSKILILLFSILIIATGCNSSSTNLDSASDTNRVISEDDSSLYYKFYNGDTIGIAINKTNMQGQKVGRWLESYTTDYTSIADVFYISGQKMVDLYVLA